MQLHYPDASFRESGDYAVRMNPGSVHPFAVITLSEDGRTYFYAEEADVDRLLSAAARVKAMFESMRRPHAFAGRSGECGECGMPAILVAHAEPVPAAAPSLTSLRCHRHPGRVYGACPECSAEIDASIARNGAPLSDGEIAALDAAAAADACAECGHLVCDCGADSGEDVTDSIAAGHDADQAVSVTEVRFAITPEALALGESIASGTPVIITDDVAAAVDDLTYAVNESHAALVAEPDGLEDAAAHDDDEAGVKVWTRKLSTGVSTYRWVLAGDVTAYLAEVDADPDREVLPDAAPAGTVLPGLPVFPASHS